MQSIIELNNSNEKIFEAVSPRGDLSIKTIRSRPVSIRLKARQYVNSRRICIVMMYHIRL